MADLPNGTNDSCQVQACLHEAQRWRQQAANLREHAALPRLTEAARSSLLYSAEWSDQTAAHWEAGADHCR